MTDEEALRDERTCTEVCFGKDKAPGSCGLLNGAAISLPPPEYPGKVAGVSVVTVHAYINEDGKVYLARGCGERRQPAALVRAAIAAAYKARFHQTTCSGKPVRIDGLIVYNFRPRKMRPGSYFKPRITAAWPRRD